MDNQQRVLQKKIMLEGINIETIFVPKRKKIDHETVKNLISDLYVYETKDLIEMYDVPNSIINKITRALKDEYTLLPIPKGLKLIPLNSPFKYGATEGGYVVSLGSRKVLAKLDKSKGYQQVAVTKYADDNSGKLVKNLSLHRLICMAYHPNPMNLPQVNHIDGNKHNNNYTNLEWCTNKENSDHAWSTGLKSLKTQARGETSGQSKLTEEDVIYIRSASKPVMDLAVKYKVTPTTILRVKRRESWTHI